MKPFLLDVALEMTTDYPLNFVYTSHATLLEQANKTNDADGILITLRFQSRLSQCYIES